MDSRALDYSRAVERLFFGLGALSASLAVALGAFAAHGLRARLSPEALTTFETCSRSPASARSARLRPSAAWPSFSAGSRWPGPRGPGADLSAISVRHISKL